MLDEKGNEIDLDRVDAVGQLKDGRFEVWLDNDRRVITSHPDAIGIRQRHFRSRSYRNADTGNRFSHANG